jgi:hypothetical protein
LPAITGEVVINKVKPTLGFMALVVCLTLIAWCLYYFQGFAVGAALGPMEANRLLIPALLAFLAFVFLVAAYYLLIKQCRKWVKLTFLLALMTPTVFLVGYAGYVSATIIAAPFFTTTVTTQIKLRLGLDDLNRPVFYFSDFHIRDGFDYDPYRKYLLEYPEEVFELSETERQVTGTIVIEYSYRRAARFWLTHIEQQPVVTNRIHGSFVPPQLETLESKK